MSKSADVCHSVASFAIAYRNFNHLEVLLNSPKNQIKVTKRIKLPKIASVGLNLLIVFSKKCLGPA